MPRVGGKLRNQRRLTRSKGRGRNVILSPNRFGHLPPSIKQMIGILSRHQPDWIDADPAFWSDALHVHYAAILSTIPDRIDRLKLKTVVRWMPRLHNLTEADVEEMSLQLSRVAPSSIQYIQQAREEQEHETRFCWLFWGLVVVLCVIIYFGATRDK